MQRNIDPGFIAGSGTEKFLPVLLLLSTLLFSCGQQTETRFELLPEERTGVGFANTLENTPDFNILNYLYFYDGGGVSIGDINGDSLPDIYFTANMLPNRLYLNKGNFTFEDITDRAGVAGSADWTTGTTFADVNGDGLLDIYVSSVNYLNKSGKNQLFINNGDLTFTDRAEEYGLDLEVYSKQATFFDYDNDGDLDMYLLNHAVHTNQTFTRAEKRNTYDEKAGDRLFRNDGGTFVDVTREAGIYSSLIGYGLAATAGDINADGCMDIYVSNDFHENDYLYLNNCDGTFREVIERATGHNSRASMGVDVADFNNDSRPDIFVLDMLPGDETSRKSSVSSEPYKVYRVQREFGYHPQLIRNTLQLNMGNREDGTPYFSEIAQLAGVSATDWSWSSLFWDMDNDGHKDLFVTNGIYRRPNDYDYLALVRTEKAQEVMRRGMSDTTMSLIQRMPHVRIPNKAFHNEGNLTFTDKNRQYGFEKAGYSNGAAYGDLDNDGDLDLVINNVNSPASIYRNHTREWQKKREESQHTGTGADSGHYLKIRLKGNGANTYGIGARVTIHTGGQTQVYEMIPTRGFLSSVEPVILAGVGSADIIDSVTVAWPNRKRQTVKKVKANSTMTLKQKNASALSSTGSRDAGDGEREAPFEKVNVENLTNGKLEHRENSYVDFEEQRLIPHLLSDEGPPIAVADVNGDGTDDFYVGGAKHRAGSLMIQTEEGTFKESNTQLFRQERSYEDVDALFFDANGDGHPDLYVVSGGNEYSYQADAYEDRLYMNDGQGQFVRLPDALPLVRENGSVVAAADYDGDGDLDLFLGTRSIPRNYGYRPDSYLLENDGDGNFADVTDRLAPGLRGLGMVTDAVWQDVGGDGMADLLIAGEWMPVTVFRNDNGTFSNQTDAAGLEQSSGWWNALQAGDFDGDGDTDIVAGNLGLNSFLKASAAEPLVMYRKDFNSDGQYDPVIARTVDGREYPVATRDELLFEFRFLRSEFPAYRDLAGKTVQQIFGSRLQDSVSVDKIFELRSSFLENDGSGSFTLHSLPAPVQFAPVTAMETGDFNNDGKADILAGGNMNGFKPSLGGRHDASYGWVLIGDENEKGKGSGSGQPPFKVAWPEESGLLIDGEVRDIRMLRSAGRELILVARNNAEMLIFEQEYSIHTPNKAGNNDRK